MSARIVYLMRGLPSCGKSYTARALTASGGVVLETDEFFYSQVGTDPSAYDYHEDLLPAAREWNFERFVKAVAEGVSPIVVDRGNGRNAETYQYARHAVDNGYQLALKEPDSPWWQEIRVLLTGLPFTRPVLYQWAEVLAEKSRANHRVPVETIRRWIDGWKHDLTVEEILHFQTPLP